MSNWILSAFADEGAPDLPGQMDVCARHGITRIEMRFVNGRNIVDHTPAEAREIRRQMDERGFSLSALGSPFGKIGIHDDFAAHLEKFKRGLELCHILGTDRVRMFSFYLPEGDDPAVHRSQVMERLARMAEIARAEAIVCCHENEKGIYGDNAARCADIAAAVEGMPLCFDPANFVQCGQRVREAYDLLESRVAYMHIKDALFADGRVVPPGQGDGDLRYVLERFSQTPGEHLLTLEPHLAAFPGFGDLEKDPDLAKKNTDAAAAFDTAANALKGLL
ncbi:MAG: sugar phosphate isomerase/epimerase family protein [Acutalibacteraceae bacterium]|jgi:sugar phosphate isomerase/epimerase